MGKSSSGLGLRLRRATHPMFVIGSCGIKFEAVSYETQKKAPALRTPLKGILRRFLSKPESLLLPELGSGEDPNSAERGNVHHLQQLLQQQRGTR